MEASPQLRRCRASRVVMWIASILLVIIWIAYRREGAPAAAIDALLIIVVVLQGALLVTRSE